MLIKVGDKFVNLMQVCWIETDYIGDGEKSLHVFFVGGGETTLDAEESKAFFTTLSAMQSSIAQQQLQMLGGNFRR